MYGGIGRGGSVMAAKARRRRRWWAVRPGHCARRHRWRGGDAERSRRRPTRRSPAGARAAVHGARRGQLVAERRSPNSSACQVGTLPVRRVDRPDLAGRALDQRADTERPARVQPDRPARRRERLRHRRLQSSVPRRVARSPPVREFCEHDHLPRRPAGQRQPRRPGVPLPERRDPRRVRCGRQPHRPEPPQRVRPPGDRRHPDRPERPRSRISCTCPTPDYHYAGDFNAENLELQIVSGDPNDAIPTRRSHRADPRARRERLPDPRRARHEDGRAGDRARDDE